MPRVLLRDGTSCRPLPWACLSHVEDAPVPGLQHRCPKLSVGNDAVARRLLRASVPASGDQAVPDRPTRGSEAGPVLLEHAACVLAIQSGAVACGIQVAAAEWGWRPWHAHVCEWRQGEQGLGPVGSGAAHVHVFEPCAPRLPRPKAPAQSTAQSTAWAGGSPWRQSTSFGGPHVASCPSPRYGPSPRSSLWRARSWRGRPSPPLPVCGTSLASPGWTTATQPPRRLRRSWQTCAFDAA
jgi:hypothetical protein